MAYVYQLTFKPTGQFYIGYRGSKTAVTDDLLVTYFTSSKVVKRLIQSHGIDSFDKMILAEFASGIEAYNYEQALLKKNNVEGNELMLNKRLTSCALDCFQKHTAKSKKRMSQSRKKLWQDDSYRGKVSESVRHSWKKPGRSDSLKTTEFRKLKKQQTSELWKDPAYREKVLDSHAKAVNKEEYKIFHRQHKKSLWEDQNYRSQQEKSRKAVWQDSDYKERMRIKRKEMWANPEYRSMMLSARKKKQ